MKHLSKSVQAAAFIAGGTNKAFVHKAGRSLAVQREEIFKSIENGPVKRQRRDFGLSYSNSHVDMSDESFARKVASPDKVDSILLDVVALSSVPEGSLKSLKPLQKKVFT